ncbi:uncharacterized protein C12orf50 homolog isoform X1 [Meleagris gallopavo]|uniref:uncharacterized protein C12orf50 homolog isoform X1 n=1 Tax=Meleagris gallopavo TaxID=9103 RepID=UPI00093CF7A0|nr:uncharacterized protein C12orf50 homolog isoform X1 [Meleagris gallopavo]
MAEGGNDRYFYSPYAQQNYSNILCFWETQPLGCVRISCIFHHSKPRNINGLFLPPSNNTVFQQEGQEGILNSAHSQESLKIQEAFLRPIHPPVVVNLSHDEDDEEEDEEEDEDNKNNISDLLEKTAEDIEEERAIKEMCYKSGEYYRIQYPQEHQSTEMVSPSPSLENEQLPMETIEHDLWKGDSNTIPTKFNNVERERETSGRKISVQCISRTHDKSYENEASFSVGGDYSAAQRNKYVNRQRSEAQSFEKTPTASKYSNIKATNSSERVRKYHFKGVKKKKWISEEQRNSPNPGIGKGIPTSYSKATTNYQRNYQRKDDETASSIHSVRQTERNTYFNSAEPRRSAYVFYRNTRVIQEPRFNGYTDRYSSGSYNAPTWRKRNPHAKTFSKFKTTVQNQAEMEMKKKGE